MLTSRQLMNRRGFLKTMTSPVPRGRASTSDNYLQQIAEQYRCKHRDHLFFEQIFKIPI